MENIWTNPASHYTHGGQINNNGGLIVTRL